ncbi:hypothetical protein H4S08_002578, partial [Coemansia sp. RSA 1365]
MIQGSHQRDPPGGDSSAVNPGQEARSMSGTPGEQAVEAWVQSHAQPDPQPPQQSATLAVTGVGPAEAPETPGSLGDRMDTAYVSTDDEEEHSMIEYEEAVELVQEAAPGLAAKIAEQMEQVIPMSGDRGDREATIMAFLEETWLLGKSAAKRLRAEAHFKAQREQLKAHRAAVTADEEELASLMAQLEKTKKRLAGHREQVEESRKRTNAALEELEGLKGTREEEVHCKEELEITLAEKERELKAKEEKLRTREAELKAVRKASQKAPAWGNATYAQKVSMRGEPGQGGPAPLQHQQKKVPMAKSPVTGDKEAANRRTPPPKWVEESGLPAALLTFTGLTGHGVSNSKLTQVMKETVHFS